MTQAFLSAAPVVQYPGIFRTSAQSPSFTIPNGTLLVSRTIDTTNLGDSTPTDFPPIFLGVHSWILAWALAVESIAVWAGSPEQWVGLRLRVVEVPESGLISPVGDDYIIPLTTDPNFLVQGSVVTGQRRIHAQQAFLELLNETGQSLVAHWDVWAKAA
ncbi:MAG: hypothetical protein ACREI9_04730 [Nitrospiraceae bacterium]